MEQNRNLRLIIKTPNRDQEDQTVDRVPPAWTVLDLKRHLSASHPSRPAVSDQRLIFSGKLIPDHLTMTDLFSQLSPQQDQLLSLHLVCPSRTRPPGPAGLTVSDPPQSGRPSHFTTAPDGSELRQRRSPAPCPAPCPAPSGASSPEPRPWLRPPSFPAVSLYSRQQLLWLQQLYAQQVYLQYHAALAAAGSAPSAPPPPVPAHRVPVPAPPAAAPAPGAALLDPAPANQNLRLNAQGGPALEDEEPAERDWLDWTYWAARVLVLLTVVFFNSSPARFLLVLSGLVLMVLHTAGWFPFRRRVQVPVQEPEQLQNQNPMEAAEGAPENGSDGPGGPGGPGGPEGPGPGPMAAVLVPPHQVSLMWTAWVFFKTFFSSLIPEVPEGVAN